MEPLPDSRPGARSRAGAFLFHGAWIIIFIVAAWWRFSFPLTPAIDRDFGGYLHPALRALGGQPFVHAEGRAILYPAIVYVVLAVFRDFRALAFFQHSLGLGTGLLLLATWCAARRALRPALVPRWIYDVAGLAMFAVHLFTPEPVRFEFLIRPDVICPFFAAMCLYLAARFLLAWRVEKKSAAAFGFAVASVFVAFVLPSLKPSFWLSAVFATIPVACALFDHRENATRRVLMAALPLGAVLLFLVLPERLSARRDRTSSTFLPESLFSIHALIIREQIAADIAAPDPVVPYSAEKLRTTLGWLDEGIASARRSSPDAMPALGYDADWLLYHDPFFSKMAEAENWDVEPRLQFYRYYFRRAWKKRPAQMLGKVANQLGLFYNFRCPAFYDRPADLRKLYTSAHQVIQRPEEQATFDAWPPARAFRASVAELKERATTIPLRKILRIALNRLGNFYLPGLIAWLAALPWVFWRAERRARFGVFAAILAVGYGLNFGNCLGIAVLHTLDVGRYTRVQFATTLITEMLTALFLAEVLLTLFRKGGAATVRE